MPPTTTPRSKLKASTSPIALLAALASFSLGLAACGGSSSTTPKASANAAAVSGATATTPSSTTPSGTTTPGGSTASTTPSTSTAPGQTGTPGMAAIRACLAKKGITLPEKHPLADAHLPSGMSHAQLYEEVQRCAGGLLPPGRGHFHRFPGAAGPKGFHNPFNNPRFHTVLARFSACLRQHGIDVGEPNTSGKGPIFDTKGINTGSPQFKAATAECRSTLLGALRPTAHPGAGRTG
jgi:hypothetical protein